MKFSQAALWIAPDPKTISMLAKNMRQSLTPLECRFASDARRRWPKTTWRRYHPISITIHPELGPSVWYAPFYCHRAKLIVALEDRRDFPYAITGHSSALYDRFGYQILDFTEDFAVPFDESVWQEALQLVGSTLRKHP